jgi:GDPmannose 4,6-dehydratase
VEKAFEPYGLDWKKYVQVDKSFFRPLDIHISKADPSKAKKLLDWQSKVTLDQVISKMAAGAY